MKVAQIKLIIWATDNKDYLNISIESFFLDTQKFYEIFCYFNITTYGKYHVNSKDFHPT